MPPEQLSPGILQVYTGEGKGKTTCALGLALQSVGLGFKVYMVQFLKGRETGESRAMARMFPDITLRFFGRVGFIKDRTAGPEDRALVQEGWNLARKIIATGEYDLVILDELNRVLAHGLLPLDEVLTAIRERPARVGIVITGRQAPPELVAMADLVTEMHPIKHYYQAGVQARRGVEW